MLFWAVTVEDSQVEELRRVRVNYYILFVPYMLVQSGEVDKAQ